MCTVVIEVPAQQAAPGDTVGAIRLLAVRDEDPKRPWDPPGAWWPEQFPGVRGVRDRQAGGAWLAYASAPARLSVILNRVPAAEAAPLAQGIRSRGHLVLDGVAGIPLSDRPATAAFTRLTVRGAHAEVASWDGVELRTESLPPGVHMIAHHNVNDHADARVARWLPEFRAIAATPAERWRDTWTTLLARTAQLDPSDDRAIVRDNTAHGYPTSSLLACVAEIGADSVSLEWAPLAVPGEWRDPVFHTAP